MITVSQFSRQDIVKHWGISEDRIGVIHNAADERFAAAVSEDQRQKTIAHHQLRQPYIFYVGGWERRKNLPFLMSAFAQAKLGDVQLVLAGGETHELLAMQRAAEQLGIASQVQLLGPIEDDDLPALYSAAICFVYPSLYEGFGLQICEAMAAGCPVLAARATALPEILGDTGATFSLDRTDELAGLLRSLVGNESRRAQMRLAGRCRAKHFNWTKTAEQTVRVYESACKLRERAT